MNFALKNWRFMPLFVAFASIWALAGAFVAQYGVPPSPL